MINRLLISSALFFMSLPGTLAQQTLTVWPGDATNNGEVNKLDFLQLGLAYNFFGPPRSNNSAQWSPQTATPWNYQFANGLNFAYADCNGDGVINYNYDAFPIYVHYGNTHGIVTPDTYNAGLPGIDPKLAFDDSQLADTVFAGQEIEVPILLGSAAVPMENFYGIAFSIMTDSGFVDLEDAQINLSEPSWANHDGDRIWSQFPVTNEHLDAAWVRTDHNERSGHGRIGKVEFIIIDDVVDNYTGINLILSDIKAVDQFGNEIIIAGDTLSLTVSPDNLPVNEKPLPGKSAFEVFPNPASDFLEIRARSPIESAILFSPLGQAILEAAPRKNSTRLNLPADLSPGIYLLRLQNRDGVFLGKVLVSD